jgi:hypothetical protein
LCVSVGESLSVQIARKDPLWLVSMRLRQTRQRFRLCICTKREFANLCSESEKQKTEKARRLIGAYDAGHTVTHGGWFPAPST